MSYAPPPHYPQYQYPQYPWPQPPQATQPRYEEGPTTTAPRGWWSDRFGLLFGIVVTVVTLTAILLAVAAPSFSTRPASAPASWNSIYSGNPKDDPNWRQNPGHCVELSAGLLAQGPGVGNVPDVLSSLCVYAPTTTRDLLSQGFALDLSVAPAANVSTAERAAVFIGDPNASEGVLAEIGQGGGLEAIYLLCDSAGSCASQPTVAWHTDGFVTNTLSLRYMVTADGGTLTLYGNGQKVASSDVTLPANPVIAIGAGSDSSALYTQFALSTASA